MSMGKRITPSHQNGYRASSNIAAARGRGRSASMEWWSQVQSLSKHQPSAGPEENRNGLKGRKEIVTEHWLFKLFHSHLSSSSRGSIVSLHILPYGWCHLRIWGFWYFFWQSWFLKCRCLLLLSPACESLSVMCDSLWPHGLYGQWNSPGQNTGVASLSLNAGDLPNPGIEPRSPTLQADSLPAELPGKP